MKPNTFVTLLDTCDRLSKRDELLKNRGYKSKWYDVVSYQTRMLITLSLILIITLSFIWLS